MKALKQVLPLATFQIYFSTVVFTLHVRAAPHEGMTISDGFCASLEYVFRCYSYYPHLYSFHAHVARHKNHRYEQTNKLIRF